jgi:hypothetical protein
MPSSVKRAIWLLWVLVLLGLLTTVLTVALRDDLIRSWADGRPDIRPLLESQGLQAVKDGAVQPPAFVPVAIVLFVMVALLIWVLVAFFRNGYDWARLSLTALLPLVAIGTVAALRAGPPSTFVVLSFVSFVIELAALVYLWHPQTNQYVRGTWIVHHDESLRAP